MDEKKDNYDKLNDLMWEKLMRMGAKLGCHQMPERSFFVCGYQFPLCARCTGLMIGYIIAIMFWDFINMPPVCSIMICIPLIVDGITQYVRWRKSNQILRLATGILCGVGSAQLEIALIIVIAKLIRGGI